MGYLLYQLGAGFLQSTVLRIQIRSTVVIPGKHDLRLAGEKAIDFQRWPLEATDFGVSMVWNFCSTRMMMIFGEGHGHLEFNISKHGTPRNLGWCRIVCMFFPMGLQRVIWDFSRLQKSKGKLTAIAIAAISFSNQTLLHLLGHPSMIFLHSSHPFIFLGFRFSVFPTGFVTENAVSEVFWKHKQKRKDVIPIVLSLEMPGSYGADGRFMGGVLGRYQSSPDHHVVF